MKDLWQMTVGDLVEAITRVMAELPSWVIRLVLDNNAESTIITYFLLSIMIAGIIAFIYWSIADLSGSHKPTRHRSDTGAEGAYDFDGCTGDSGSDGGE